jgi:hypothetical protein
MSFISRHLHSRIPHRHFAFSQATVCLSIGLASLPRPRKGRHGREPRHPQYRRLAPRQSRGARGPILGTDSQAKPETANYYRPEYTSNGFVIRCRVRLIFAGRYGLGVSSERMRRMESYSHTVIAQGSEVLSNVVDEIFEGHILYPRRASRSGAASRRSSIFSSTQPPKPDWLRDGSAAVVRGLLSIWLRLGGDEIETSSPKAAPLCLSCGL